MPDRRTSILAKLAFWSTTLILYQKAAQTHQNRKLFSFAMASTPAAGVGPALRREGPELPLSRPTLATTHPELGSLGERIITEIQSIIEQGNNCTVQDDFMGLFRRLPEFLLTVESFIGTALAVRGPNDSIAHWVEQTYRTVQRLGKSVNSAPSSSSTAVGPSPPSNKPSYAKVASLPVSESENQLRQIKVRITNSIERAKVWKRPNESILQAVATNTKAGVVGVKKLPSGDLVIQLKEQKGKGQLGQERAWLSQVAGSAQVLPDLFPVLVHGVRLSQVNTTKQAKAARELERQNIVLHPGLRIERLAWPKGIHKLGKKSSSLTVFLTSPEAANKVIREGFIESGEVHMVERFQTGCGLVQCFRCCGYGHIAKHCRVEARCGHCGGSHETRSCEKSKEPNGYCSNCKGSHKAWSEECPVRKKTRTMLVERLWSRAGIYPEVVRPDHRIPVNMSRPTSSQATPASTLRVGIEPPVQERRKPGRPKGSGSKGPGSAGPSSGAQPVEAGPGGPPLKRPRQATLAFEPMDEGQG